MTGQVGEFLRSAVANRVARSLEDQLVMEIYLQELDAQLSRADEACQLFARARKAPGLHDFENVLLRHDDAQQWRQYVTGTVQRKGANEQIKAVLETLSKKNWLPPAGGSLEARHPVAQALAATREKLKTKYRVAALKEVDLQALCGEMERLLAVPTLREWLCRSLRRVLNERS